MPLLEGYRFSFDPWRYREVEEEVFEESEEIEDVYIETDLWKPIEGTPCPDADVVFVDGVRRTENLINIEKEEGDITQGAFVSLGAGALHMKIGRLNTAPESFKNLSVRRYLFIRDDIGLVGRTLTFDLGMSKVSFSVDRAKGEISPYVNEVMKRLESVVAEATYKEIKPALMITDGTVHYNAKVKDLPFVGYVKKQRKLYLPQDKVGILRDLGVGERTPLVRIHPQSAEDSGNLDKFTWYVRISEHEGLGGIARLEVSAGIGLERAKELANMSAWIIPKFASTEISDSRAPHNLLPIKHLENVLRRHLGSQLIIRRLIQRELSKA